MKLALFAFLIPCLSSAQGIQQWRFFGPEKGMGMGFQKIIQDHYGFIWCASSNGLYRYDGQEFKAFKKYVTHDNPLSSDFIWDILEDEQHNIWLATYDGGVNKWERKTGNFLYYRHDPGNANTLASDNVLRMMKSREGPLWLIVEQENGVPALDRLDPGSGRVQHYRRQPENALSINSDTISAIALAGNPLEPMLEDGQGQIWVATKGGLNLYVPAGNGFRNIPGPWASRGEQIIHLYESPAVPGLIWILAATEGLSRGHVYQLNSKTKNVGTLPFSLKGLLTFAPTGIYHPPGRPDELWLSSRELCRLNLKDGSSRRYSPELQYDASLWQGTRDSLFSICPGPAGQPWLLPLGFPPAAHTRGSEKYYIRDGFYRWDENQEQLELISRNPQRPGQAFGMVYSVSPGRNGNTWIGCFPGFYQLRQEKPGQRARPAFQDIQLWESSAAPANLSAWAAVERPAGVLWAATFKGGLKRVNLNSGEVVSFRNQPENPASIAHDNVFALFEDKQHGRLWIGTENGLDWVGLDELDSENPALVFQHLPQDDRLTLEITSITRAPDGLLWIGTPHEGLLLFDPVNERVLEQYKAGAGEGALNRSYINTAFTDSQGRHWVANGMGGLCQALPTEEGQQSFVFQCHLDGMYIVDVFENADGKLWLAAMNYGIAIFDPETGKHELWNMENHLSRNSVLGIEQDEQGMIWFTSLGITRHDPKTGAFRPFRLPDGIRDEDPGRLLLTLQDGRMVYSSINGWLQVFDPNEVRSNSAPPQAVITGLQYFDPARKANVPLPLKDNIEAAAEIRLQYHQQPFTIEYAGMEFSDPEGIRYATKMEGYETQWDTTRERRTGRYLQVPPGSYTFLLKAANSDGVWMEEPLRLQIAIVPPWWRTNAAFLAYGLLFCLGAYRFYLFQRRRWRLQAQLEFEQREAARLKELDAVKTRLFTDIAHEIRTPLAVIEGIAGQIREKPREWVNNGVEMIQRNSRQLLRLANQLLDLSMLESGSMAVNMIQGDVMPFIRATLEPFATFAAHKGIRWKAVLEPEQLVMDYEPDKLQKILSNLVSNALKFTSRGQAVTVRCRKVEADGKPHFQAIVEDTGKGIPARDLPFIFDRGFSGHTGAASAISEDKESGGNEPRKKEGPAAPAAGRPFSSSPGAGIGLALTRELTQLLGGSIKASSREGAGASFRLLLPITKKAPPDQATPAPPIEEILPGGPETPGGTKPRRRHSLKLLIVEDNSDVNQYLSAILYDNYELMVATDGKQGLEKAIREVPDIIISDIMMPEMDGLELCKLLKDDLKTSHIPILLLSARADALSRTQGFETGADAYLSKPFSKRELLAQLQQLADNRKRLQDHYQANLQNKALPNEAPEELGREEAFLLQAHQVVISQLPNADFGPKELCKALQMSKTQLHNKLTALTGRSTALFIRGIRLQYARQALEQTPGLTVTQAAYDAGFKDPNYFSRCFKKEFGMSPKEVRP
ncbi:MAG: response regulator [Lewinellaceae bacterium]|nr:response regulator [Lewinellaceae bacterium]